jgi:hypothetical protein
VRLRLAVAACAALVLVLVSAGRGDEATRALAEETRAQPPPELVDFLEGLRKIDEESVGR